MLLKELHAADNAFAGGVPPSLGDAPRLASLRLRGNRLTGSIPPGLGNAKELVRLDLSGNKLSGSIPSALADAAELAELALGGPDAVDWAAGVANCTRLGYEANQPTSAAATALAEEGYYALSCRAHADRLFDVLQPYSEATELLTILCVVGVALYFITSSDSGSYVDDIIAANGMPVSYTHLTLPTKA